MGIGGRAGSVAGLCGHLRAGDGLLWGYLELPCVGERRLVLAKSITT